MKTISIDDELYRYIASKTEYIGESASQILRRLLVLPENSEIPLKGRGNRKGEHHENDSAQISIIDDQTLLLKLIQDNAFIEEKKAIRRFMQILTLLYQINPEQFGEATESLRGRTRIYFSKQKDMLLANGENTKPQMIPETPYWVITNINSIRKRMILKQIMTKMKISQSAIEKVNQYF